jgi:hypothetical protein
MLGLSDMLSPRAAELLPLAQRHNCVAIQTMSVRYAPRGAPCTILSIGMKTSELSCSHLNIEHIAYPLKASALMLRLLLEWISITIEIGSDIEC